MEYIHNLHVLPDHVILQIIQQLPNDFITDFFLRDSSDNGQIIRKLLISEYYGQELHFIVSPTRRPYFSALPQDKRHYVTFKGVYEIKNFVLENPDILPRRLLLISGGDFSGLQDLMTRFRSRFEHIPYLDITLESGSEPIDGRDLEFLLSFANLRKLHCSSKLTHCRQVLSNLFKDHSCLEEIVLLGHGISNWSHVRFPKLKSLDISWTQQIDVRTISVPPSTKEIYWNMANISDQVMADLHFPNLTTLMLTYNKIETLDLSKLPRTLENLDVSENHLVNIVDSSGLGWPTALKSLLLGMTHINNDLLAKVSSLGWPPALETLVLSSNPFTKLHNLYGLPISLRFLNLASTQITSLYDHRVPYEFPPNLQILRLANCSEIRHVASRFKFPHTITDLDLSECNISSLDVFEFPTGVEKLALLGNKITDLNSYGPWNLDSLVELDLFSNWISSLSGWKVPKSLCSLDLRINKFTELTNHTFLTPHCEITHLNLSQNSIRHIDAALEVPYNLRTLYLSENALRGTLHVPNSLAHHPHLRTLDLSQNYIGAITIDPNPKRGSLRTLNLYGNLLFKGTKDKEEILKFYKVLEKGFGVDAAVRFNVNVQHTFT